MCCFLTSSNCFIDPAEQFGGKCVGATATGVVFWPYLSISLMQFDLIWLEGKRTVGAAATDRHFQSHPSICFINSAELFGRRPPVGFGSPICQWVWSSLVRGQARHHCGLVVAGPSLWVGSCESGVGRSLWVGCYEFGVLSVVVDRSLWIGRCGSIAVIRLRVGRYELVAVGRLLWARGCGLVAVGRSLWVDCYGSIALGQSLWVGCYESVGRCGSVIVGRLLRVGRTSVAVSRCASVAVGGFAVYTSPFNIFHRVYTRPCISTPPCVYKKIAVDHGCSPTDCWKDRELLRKMS